jgi:hypothetical protein
MIYEPDHRQTWYIVVECSELSACTLALNDITELLFTTIIQKQIRTKKNLFDIQQWMMIQQDSTLTMPNVPGQSGNYYKDYPSSSE